VQESQCEGSRIDFNFPKKTISTMVSREFGGFEPESDCMGVEDPSPRNNNTVFPRFSPSLMRALKGGHSSRGNERNMNHGNPNPAASPDTLAAAARAYRSNFDRSYENLNKTKFKLSENATDSEDLSKSVEVDLTRSVSGESTDDESDDVDAMDDGEPETSEMPSMMSCEGSESESPISAVIDRIKKSKPPVVYDNRSSPVTNSNFNTTRSSPVKSTFVVQRSSPPVKDKKSSPAKKFSPPKRPEVRETKSSMLRASSCRPGSASSRNSRKAGTQKKVKQPNASSSASSTSSESGELWSRRREVPAPTPGFHQPKESRFVVDRAGRTPQNGASNTGPAVTHNLRTSPCEGNSSSRRRRETGRNKISDDSDYTTDDHDAFVDYAREFPTGLSERTLDSAEVFNELQQLALKLKHPSCWRASDLDTNGNVNDNIKAENPNSNWLRPPTGAAEVGDLSCRSRDSNRAIRADHRELFRNRSASGLRSGSGLLSARDNDGTASSGRQRAWSSEWPEWSSLSDRPGVTGRRLSSNSRPVVTGAGLNSNLNSNLNNNASITTEGITENLNTHRSVQSAQNTSIWDEIKDQEGLWDSSRSYQPTANHESQVDGGIKNEFSEPAAPGIAAKSFLPNMLSVTSTDDIAREERQLLEDEVRCLRQERSHLKGEVERWSDALGGLSNRAEDNSNWNLSKMSSKMSMENGNGGNTGDVPMSDCGEHREDLTHSSQNENRDDRHNRSYEILINNQRTKQHLKNNHHEWTPQIVNGVTEIVSDLRLEFDLEKQRFQEEFVEKVKAEYEEKKEREEIKWKLRAEKIEYERELLKATKRELIATVAEQKRGIEKEKREMEKEKEKIREERRELESKKVEWEGEREEKEIAERKEELRRRREGSLNTGGDGNADAESMGGNAIPLASVSTIGEKKGNAQKRGAGLSGGRNTEARLAEREKKGTMRSRSRGAGSDGKNLAQVHKMVENEKQRRELGQG
jgi:hypothetical protein